MQINIKQNEIIAALTAYIAGQGINLAGKTVGISFTAGRKETGVSADIIIEDATAKSPLGLAPLNVEPTPDPVKDPVPHGYVEPVQVEQEPATEVQATPASLFG